MDANLKEGLELSQLAVGHDTAGRTREASALYLQACNLLLLAAEKEPHPGKQSVIRGKANEYQARGNELRIIIQQQQQQAQAQQPLESLLDAPLMPAAGGVEPTEWANLVTPAASSGQLTSASAPDVSSDFSAADLGRDVLTEAEKAELRAMEAETGDERSVTEVAGKLEPSVDEKMEMMQQAIHLVEQASLALQQGGERVADAVEGFKLGLGRLEHLFEIESSPKMKRELDNRIKQLKLRIVHTRVHELAKSKLSEVAMLAYLDAAKCFERARSTDELSQFPDAIKLYKLTNTKFKQALETEYNPYAKKIIGKRMVLCNQRVTQLESFVALRNSGAAVSTSSPSAPLVTPPAVTGQPSASASEYAVAVEPAGLLDKWKGAFNSLIGVEVVVDRGVVGTMINERPDCDGEWLSCIHIKGTKTMTNPGRTKTYTVYILEIVCKVMHDGEHIDTKKWQAVRRFSQFKLLNAKLKTLELVAMPELPSEHLLDNVLNPMIVAERRKGLQSYFNILLHMPPNAHLNRILLRFLSNSFQE